MIDSAPLLPGRQPFLDDSVICLAAPSFALSPRDGQLRGTGVDGFYDQDQRLLHTLRLLVDDQEPEHVAYRTEGSREAFFQAVCRSSEDPTSAPWLLVTRERAVRRPGVAVTEPEPAADSGDVVLVQNVGPEAARFILSVVAATDLADVATIKAGVPATDIPGELGEGLAPEVRWHSPRDNSEVVLRAEPVPLNGGGLEPKITLDDHRPGLAEFRWELLLRSGEEWSVRLVVQGGTTTVADYPVPPRQPAPWGPVEVTGHERMAALLTKGLADLEALRLAEPTASADGRENQFVAAGCPWFLGLFGRDSIWAARMMLPFGTELARGTLRTLAGRQGRHHDAFTDEAPGRILHELRPTETRHGDGMVLPARYYASVDATPLFVVLLHEAWKWGLAEKEVRLLLPQARAAMEWVAATLGPDDLISYGKGRADGLLHQGWKDSPDAIRDAEGRRVDPPIALCEVQGYAYQAAVGYAELLTALQDDKKEAQVWLDRASRIRAAFQRSFWVEEPDGRRYPAIAVDGAGRPVTGRTSNMGHLLNSGILQSEEEHRAVAEALMSDGLRTPWGIRTRSAHLAGFNPFGYHGGSVWAHDSAIAVHGLAATGFVDEAATLLDGMLDAARHFDHRLPELYAVYANSRFDRPAPYPPSCRPQAWAAAAAALLCSAMLRVDADVPDRRLTLRPIAPSRMGLESPYAVRGLRLGERSVDVTVDLHGGVRVSGIDTEEWRIDA